LWQTCRFAVHLQDFMGSANAGNHAWIESPQLQDRVIPRQIPIANRFADVELVDLYVAPLALVSIPRCANASDHPCNAEHESERDQTSRCLRRELLHVCPTYAKGAALSESVNWRFFSASSELSSCSTFCAPISAEVTRSSRSTHAIAICASVCPCLFAMITPQKLPRWK
jgi:hypothetical protein